MFHIRIVWYDSDLMKALAGTVIGIAVVIIGSFVFSYIRNTQTPQKESVEAETSKDSSGTLAAAKLKVKEVDRILGKLGPSFDEQAKAKQLVNEAVQEVRQITNEQPKNVDAWFFLGQIYERFYELDPNSPKHAIEAFSHAVILAPNNPAYLEHRGTAYLAAKKYQEAEKDFIQSMKLGLVTASVYAKLGQVSKEFGKKEEAIAYFKRAKELAPKTDKLGRMQFDYELDMLATASASKTGGKK